jgi:hypothetical protein
MTKGIGDKVVDFIEKKEADSRDTEFIIFHHPSPVEPKNSLTAALETCSKV